MGWWTQARVNPDQGRCGVMITVGRQRCGAQVAAAGGVPAAGAASHCRMARSTASGWSSIGQCPASAPRRCPRALVVGRAPGGRSSSLLANEQLSPEPIVTLFLVLYQRTLFQNVLCYNVLLSFF